MDNTMNLFFPVSVISCGMVMSRLGENGSCSSSSDHMDLIRSDVELHGLVDSEVLGTFF